MDYYEAYVVTAQDYYPFGLLMPGMQFGASGNYRFGFNGKENDSEVKGSGNQQDYGMRIYDPRLGRFLSVDPLIKDYSMLTPYQFARNRPIDGIDMDGLEYLQYNIVLDYRTSNVLSKTPGRYNPVQHSAHGELGQGVMYKISRYDDKLGLHRDIRFEFVSRNAKADPFGLFSAEYGLYMGATSLYKLDSKGDFAYEYDYSLPAVDAVDNFAKKHDQVYDRLLAVGASGLFDDWGTTAADEAALNGLRSFRAYYKVGDKDSFNGQIITEGVRKSAWRAITLFKNVVSAKKENIHRWMLKNYKGEVNSSSEYSYKLFYEKYMEQSKDGRWERKKGMWQKEDGNWKPIVPKNANE